MILELDCGNSFIKWRVLESDKARIFAEGVVGSDASLIDSLFALTGLALKDCRLVSVRASDETSQLVATLVEAFGVKVLCAASARQQWGILDNGRKPDPAMPRV